MKADCDVRLGCSMEQLGLVQWVSLASDSSQRVMSYSHQFQFLLIVTSIDHFLFQLPIPLSSQLLALHSRPMELGS